ncbi:hypothetical protein ERJ75_001085200 [Trypanosoma vivax]|nr:hypothetical protein ERJ75_001085200 [Trypanosoma vivax]
MGERQQLLAAQDEETLRRYYARRGASRNAKDSDAGHDVQMRGCHTERFTLVVDEADLIFHSTEMRNIVANFVLEYAITEGHSPTKRQRTGGSFGESAEAGARGKPKEQGRPDTATERIAMDMAFVGATVTTSPELEQYALSTCASLGSKLHKVVLK